MAIAALAAGCGGGGGTGSTKEPARSQAAVRMMVPNLVGMGEIKAHAIAEHHGLTIRWMTHFGRLSNGHTNVAA